MEKIAYALNDLWVRIPYFSYMIIAIPGLASLFLTWRQKWNISRPVYFVTFGILTLFLSIGNYIWSDTAATLEVGSLSFNILTVFIIYIISGLVFGIASAGRSRDFSGRSIYAILALIPVANLLLFYRGSKVRKQLDLANRIFLVGYVLVGTICLVIAFLITSKADIQKDVFMQSALTKPAEEQVQFLIRTRGLRETLEILARNAPGPINVDDVTKYVRSEAQGKTIIRVLEVSLEKNNLPRDLRDRVIKSVCLRPATASIIREGGTVADRYVNKKGEVLAEVLVFANDCKI